MSRCFVFQSNVYRATRGRDITLYIYIPWLMYTSLSLLDLLAARDVLPNEELNKEEQVAAVHECTCDENGLRVLAPAAAGGLVVTHGKHDREQDPEHHLHNLSHGQQLVPLWSETQLRQGVVVVHERVDRGIHANEERSFFQREPVCQYHESLLRSGILNFCLT